MNFFKPKDSIKLQKMTSLISFISCAMIFFYIETLIQHGNWFCSHRLIDLSESYSLDQKNDLTYIWLSISSNPNFLNQTKRNAWKPMNLQMCIMFLLYWSTLIKNRPFWKAVRFFWPILYIINFLSVFSIYHKLKISWTQLNAFQSNSKKFFFLTNMFEYLSTYIWYAP